MAETSCKCVVANDSLTLLHTYVRTYMAIRSSRSICHLQGMLLFTLGGKAGAYCSLLSILQSSFSMPCHSPVFCRNVSPLCRNSWDPSVPLMSPSPWSFSALLRSLVCLMPRKGSVRRWPWFGRGRDRYVTYSSQHTQDCTSHQWKNLPGEGWAEGACTWGGREGEGSL